MGAMDRMFEARQQSGNAKKEEPKEKPVKPAKKEVKEPVVEQQDRKRGRQSSFAPLAEKTEALRADCTMEQKLKYKIWAAKHKMTISELIIYGIEEYMSNHD